MKICKKIIFINVKKRNVITFFKNKQKKIKQYIYKKTTIVIK